MGIKDDNIQCCIIMWSRGQPEVILVGDQWFSIRLMGVVSSERKSSIKCNE